MDFNSCIRWGIGPDPAAPDNLSWRRRPLGKQMKTPVLAAGHGAVVPPGRRGPGSLKRSFILRSRVLFPFLLSSLIFLTGCNKPHSPGDPITPRPSKLNGQPAPRFTLPSDDGSDVSSSEFIGKSKLVLIFYRGYW